MALPRILPLAKDIELPISKLHATVQAFTVKEEKNLLLSKDLGDLILENSLLRLIALKTTFKEEGAKVDDLCLCDVLVLLVEILALSKTAKQELAFRCSNMISKGKDKEKHECGTRINLTVNLSDYRIEGESENGKLVNLTDNIGVELQYPKYSTIAPLQGKENITEDDYLNVYADCIKAVYEGDEMHTDFTKEELLAWFNELPGEHLKTFVDFVEKMPRLVLDYEVKCPNCGNKLDFHAVNVLDFFTSSTAQTE